MKADIEQLKAIIFNSLDSVYVMCKASAKEINKLNGMHPIENIPLSMYRLIINNNKLFPVTSSLKEFNSSCDSSMVHAKDIMDNYNNLLESVFKFAVFEAKINNVDSVPLPFILQSIERTKEQLTKDLKQ